MQNIKYLKLLLFSVLFITTTQISLYSKKNSYLKIEELYLNSFRTELQREDYFQAYNQETEEINPQILEVIINQKFIIPRNNTQVILKLFKRDTLCQPISPIKTSKKLFENLEVLCGQNNANSHLLSKIDRTQSYAGRIMLAKMLLEPTADIEELNHRQEIVKTLLEDNNIEVLEEVITEYKQHEAVLLNFFDRSEFNRLFGSENYMPDAIWPIHIIMSMLPEEVAKEIKLTGLINQINSNKTNLNFLHTFLLGMDIIKMYKLITRTIPSEYSEMKEDWQKSKSRFKDNNFIGSAWSSGFTIIDGLGLLSNTLSIGYNIKNTKEKYEHVKNVHSRLNKIAKIITCTDKIKTLVSSNPKLNKKFKELEELDKYFQNFALQNVLFNKLLLSLRSEIYAKENAPFMYLYLLKGEILQTAYLLVKTQKQLIKFLKAIGEIDAYLSIAKLYKESQNNNAKFCFANYLDQENSYIKTNNFWTPFINPKKAITNSLELGKINGEKCTLISGPNAGGKSTILKSTILNALLAQTITIAPSESCELTPFDYIDSYLNITDDISGGNSLFKSEVLRVKNLLSMIKENSKSLIIVDEMFSGTNPIEGAAASFAVGEHIAKLANKKNNVLALFASHYSVMTDLEEKTNGIFKNYKVKANVNNIDHTITYPFKLIEGKSNQTIAIDLLESEDFDKSIIDSARQVVLTSSPYA